MKESAAKILILILLGLSFQNICGQTAAVKFNVLIPDSVIQNQSPVFLTGSFNGWKPDDSLYIMSKTGKEMYSLTVPVFDGKKYEYKYTMGDWNTLETNANGEIIENRKMISSDGLVISDVARYWKIQKQKPAPDSSIVFNEAQTNEIAAIKDDATKKLMAKLMPTLGSIKNSFQNMLSENPDPVLRKKYHDLTVKSIDEALNIFGDAFGKVASVLTPEQKKAILMKLTSSNDPGEIFNIFSNGMQKKNK